MKIVQVEVFVVQERRWKDITTNKNTSNKSSKTIKFCTTSLAYQQHATCPSARMQGRVAGLFMGCSAVCHPAWCRPPFCEF